MTGLRVWGTCQCFYCDILILNFKWRLSVMKLVLGTHLALFFGYILITNTVIHRYSSALELVKTCTHHILVAKISQHSALPLARQNASSLISWAPLGDAVSWWTRGQWVSFTVAPEHAESTHICHYCLVLLYVLSANCRSQKMLRVTPTLKDSS